MPEKSPHDELLKESAKLAKKGEFKKAIKALQAALEIQKLSSTMLSISELYLQHFQNFTSGDDQTELLHQAAVYAARVLRGAPSAEQAEQAEALLKRVGAPARKRVEEEMAAETRRDLNERAGAETTAQLPSRLLASRAGPPAPQPPTQAPGSGAAAAAALADDLFGCRVASAPAPTASPPPQAALALPAPREGGGAHAGAEAARAEALSAMRRIAASIDRMAASGRAEELQSVVRALQKLDAHIQ
jgi:hypothetical protein